MKHSYDINFFAFVVHAKPWKSSFLPTVTLSLTLAIVGCASVPKAPEKPDKITCKDYTYTKEYTSWVLKRDMNEYKDLVAVSIALVDDQTIVWTEGFGFADREKKIPATPETVYMVGSVSKLLTATAVMKFADQGKMEIDKPLQTYLPEFSMKSRFPNSAPITPRSVLAHHSGLPSDWANGMLTYKELPELQNGYAQLVHKIKDDYVANPPNFCFSYSNLGYSLLGHTVEKVSGVDFVSFMDDSVLSPIGMTHSTFWPPKQKSHLSKSYRKGKETDMMVGRDLPAGALCADVLDMSRFMMMVFADGKAGDKQILKPETVSEMLQPQNRDVAMDFDFRIGMPWWLFDWGGVKMAFHGGDIGTFNSALFILPEHKLGVVILTNSPFLFYESAVEALKLALEAKTGMTLKEPEPSPIAATSREKLTALEGTYASGMGLMSFKAKGENLKGEVWGRTFTLKPHQDGRFSLHYSFLGLVPIKNSALERIRLSFFEAEGRHLMAFSIAGMTMGIGERIQKSVVSQAWLNRLGKYEITNLDDNYLAFIRDFKLRYDEGFLLLDVKVGTGEGREISVALKPVSDTEAVIQGVGRNMGETVRVLNVNGDERLWYSGLEMRKK